MKMHAFPNFPIGIVTERDILYRVIVENKSQYEATVKEVMSSLPLARDILMNKKCFSLV